MGRHLEGEDDVLREVEADDGRDEHRAGCDHQPVAQLREVLHQRQLFVPFRERLPHGARLESLSEQGISERRDTPP